jgi:hypothetical protein
LLQDLRGLQVAGLEEGWDDGLDDWSTPELAALSSARSEATQQLDALMKTTAMLSARPWRLGWLMAALGACLVAGGLAAVAMRSDTLLAGASASGRPQKRGTVWAQLYQAKLADTESAWLSVSEFFPETSPENVYAANLAREGLARYYLWQSGEYDKALPVLDALIASDDSQQEFRAFGLAGKCVALYLTGRSDEARQLFVELTPMIDKLDPSMRRTLNDLIASDRSAMSRETQRNLERFKAELANEE